MYQYGQYCPIARAAELLADRWTVLIVRELLVNVSCFNDLERGLPGISRPLLSERLRRLVHGGVLERRAAERGRRIEYRLTAAGRELRCVISALGKWGVRRAFGEPRPSELDPAILLWWMRRRVCTDAIPRRRVVIQFDFRGAAKRTYWLVIKSSEASICLKHPGFDVDLLVKADVAAMYDVWFGRAKLSDAVRKRDICLQGLPAMVQAYPRWFALSPLAERVRARLRSGNLRGQTTKG